MSELFNGIFGDKNWFQSLTAWGLVLFAAATAGAESACAAGMASVETCSVIQDVATKISAVLVTLGLRKGLN